jgi:hypothetical protein
MCATHLPGHDVPGRAQMTRIFRRVALTIQRAFNQFDPASHRFRERAIDCEVSPIFILSVPRSGSTLLYQLMQRSMGLMAITNLMALAPRYMVRTARYSNARVAGPDAPLLPGHYGFLPGLHGLSEAGKVMDRWFDPEADGRHRKGVRSMVAALQAQCGRPLLVKSLSLVNRINSVAETLPEARIVILHRDARFVVQSLLRGQADGKVSADQWEGVQPPGYSDRMDMDEVRRAAWQVATLTEQLAACSRLFERRRIAQIEYERLCSMPRQELELLAKSIGRPYSPLTVPERLDLSAKRTIAPEYWERIENACMEFGLSWANRSID